MKQFDLKLGDRFTFTGSSDVWIITRAEEGHTVKAICLRTGQYGEFTGEAEVALAASTCGASSTDQTYDAANRREGKEAFLTKEQWVEIDVVARRDREGKEKEMTQAIDIILRHQCRDTALDTCVRIAMCYWKDACFEDAKTGLSYHQFADIPFGWTNEIFIYRSPADKVIWDANDRSEPAVNSMLYVLLGDNVLTICLDDPNAPEVAGLLQSLRDVLQLGLPPACASRSRRVMIPRPRRSAKS